jgi:hypothetical protein
MSSEGKSESKHAYQKPELKVIDLKAGEVLAVGCKSAVGGGFGAGPCDNVPCAGIGS